MTRDTTALTRQELEAEIVRLRAIIDSSGAFAIIATNTSGHVTDWSSGAESILGWSAEEMRGETLRRIFTPEDLARARVEEEMDKAGEQGRASDERWHLKKDGSRFWASGEMMLLKDNGGNPLGFVKILRDRTEGHVAGRKLREVQSRLQRAQEAAGVGVFAVGMEDGILEPTPEFCRLYGLSPQETYRAEAFEDLVIPEDVAMVSTAESRRAGEAPRDVEYRIRRADTGELRWIARKGEIERDDAGRPVRFVGVSRDITGEVQAREELRSERELLAQMFEQAPTFMALLQGPQHRFERVNPGYTRLIGGREVVGKTVAEALPDAVAQGYLGLLDEVHRSGKPFAASGSKFAVQATIDGPVDERYVDFVYQPIREVDGEVRGIFVEGVDVTERTVASAALAASEARYRTLFESIEVGFCIIEMIFDGTRQAVDYKILEANPAFARQSGANVVGKRASEFAPNLEQHWLDTYGRVALTGEPAHVEDRAEVFGRWFDVRAFRAGNPEMHQVAILFSDITQRRQTELHQAALLELGEALRDLSSPADLAFAACAVLGRALDVSRVGYGIIDKVRETVAIDRDWNAPGVKSLAGTLRFRDYGSYIEDLKRGETVVMSDVRTDHRTRGSASSLEAISARSFINMPLVEQGQSVALLYVNHGKPRLWTDAEIILIRQVAERVRTATERSRTESALRDSEEQFRIFAQAMPNHVWAASSDGLLYWFNAQVNAYSGKTSDELSGVGWTALVHPEDLERAGQAWSAALAHGTVYETEFRIRRHDGLHRWFLVRAEPIRDVKGLVTRWIGTNTDIHDQKRTADELAQLNAGLEQEVVQRTRDRDRLWRLSTDIMVVADFDTKIVAANPAWTWLLGWAEGELLGRPFMEFVHPEDLDDTLVAATSLSTGSNIPRFENRYRHKDGSYRWISWAAVPDEHHIHGIGRDIQAEKEAAEALRRTEEALRQSQKMEAVGQLTGGLAHDFNNLLTGITGSLDLMTTRIAQGRFQDIERYTAAAQGAAKRAASLTHRLLAFSRQQTLDPKPTDINRLIVGLEELVRRTVGPAVELETVTAGGLWPTMVDQNQLENALLNLCINARDAMPDGGRLTIETGNRWLDARAANERDLAPGQYVSLCVSDTGTGMSPDIIAKAFDPFFTTKPIGKGTGLGLSMIYGFARQSNGQVRIYSEPGEGTMVCIYLPRHRGPVEDAEALPELADAPRAAAGETVLIVDDEPTVRMLVTEVLEELGYAAIEAADAASGLKVLQSDARIDLLVTDVGLPGGMNGRQMADAARVVRPALNVLFITGFAENAVVGNGHLEPGMHVMTKPFAMDALASRIKDLIVSARSSNDL